MAKDPKISVRDIGDLHQEEVDFLSKLCYDADWGYMGMYVDLCERARNEWKKTDFLCDVWRYDNGVGNVNCWAIAQNLLYKHEDYLELSIWTPSGKRGNGYAQELMTRIESTYKESGRKVSIWPDENSVKLFGKFREYPFHSFDMGTYTETGKYKKYKHEKGL